MDKPMETGPDAAVRLTGAALAIAAEGGWAEATLRGIAERAGLSYAEAWAIARTPEAVVRCLLHQARDAAMAAPLPDGSLSAKDRIFDAAMQVLEALEPAREGLSAMARTYRRRPLQGAELAGAVAGLARLSLDRAGVTASGLSGGVRVAALSRILLRMLQDFGADEDGLPATMAALDQRLREAESWAKRLGWTERRADGV